MTTRRTINHKERDKGMVVFHGVHWGTVGTDQRLPFPEKLLSQVVESRVQEFVLCPLLRDLSKLRGRVRKRRLVRASVIAEAIGRIKQRCPRVARYYSISYDEESSEVCWEVRAERKTKAETLDGAYMLKTDRKDLSAQPKAGLWSLDVLSSLSIFFLTYLQHIWYLSSENVDT